MDLGLQGKAVIITGGGRGIGLVDAQTFAAEGANVVIAELNLDLARKGAEEVRRTGGDCLAVHCDVTKPEMVQDMVMATIERFGRIDVLVNNATVVMRASRWVEATAEDVAREMDVIYRGSSNCMRAVIPHMVQRRSGAIISMLTDGARVADARVAGYAAAKSAVGSLSRTLARELGEYGIRVNCVSPSMTMTELAREGRQIELQKLGEEKFQDLMKRRLRLYPLGRLGEPQDIANAVVFLASERAGWITGQTLSVNGGYAIGPW